MAVTRRIIVKVIHVILAEKINPKMEKIYKSMISKIAVTGGYAFFIMMKNSK